MKTHHAWVLVIAVGLAVCCALPPPVGGVMRWHDPRLDTPTGDRGPATDAILLSLTGIAVGPDGTLYLVDRWRQQVRKVDAWGTLRLVAGDGWFSFAYRFPDGRSAGNGGPAIKASLNGPTDVAVGDDGSIYIIEEGSNLIRRVDRAGIITTAAGILFDPHRPWLNMESGKVGYYWYIDNIALGSDGSIYVTDQYHESARVRRASPEGIITTVVGGCVPCVDCDCYPVLIRARGYWLGLAVGSDGALYVTESGGSRVFRVASDRSVTIVAGDGWQDLFQTGRFAGDGGPATEASLYEPRRLAMGPDGSLYISDVGNRRVRKVDPKGIITTVAGNGKLGHWGDGGPATRASIGWPGALAVGPDGSLYIGTASAGSKYVRKVDPRGIITTVAGTGWLGRLDGWW